MKNFRKYQNRPIITAQGDIADGSFLIDDELTIRCKDGLLNDDIDPETGASLPAIELADGTHIEHWKNGLLHCEKEPAVIDLVDMYEEWWHNGVQVMPQDIEQ